MTCSTHSTSSIPTSKLRKKLTGNAQECRDLDVFDYWWEHNSSLTLIFHCLCSLWQPFPLCNASIPLGNAWRSFCAGLFLWCRAVGSFWILCGGSCIFMFLPRRHLPCWKYVRWVLAISSIDNFVDEGVLLLPPPLPFPVFWEYQILTWDPWRAYKDNPCLFGIFHP